MKNFTHVLSKITTLSFLSTLMTLCVFLSLEVSGQAPAPAPTQVDWQVKGDGSQVFVKWVYKDVVTGSNQFIVEQKIDAGAFVQIGSAVPYTGAEDYSVTVTGLASGSTYTWRVKMQSDDGGVTLVSPYATSPALTVVLMSGTATLGEINKSNESLTFYLNDGVTGETAYRILLSENGGPFVYNRDVNPANNEIQVTIFGLNANTTYRVQAVAYNGSNELNSNEITIKTNRALPPQATSFVASSVCPEKANISFVFTDRSQFDRWTIVNQVTNQQVLGGTSTNSDQKTITGLTPNTTYTFLLYTFNETGSTPSALTFTTPVYQAPIGQTNITDFYDITTSSLTLAWTNGAEDNACLNRIRDENLIFLSIVERDGATREVALATFGSSTSYTIKDLKPKSTVTATLAASNTTFGFLGYGDRTVTGTTFGPPYDPTDFVGTAGKDVLGDNEIVLTWKDNAEDEVGTIIELGDGNGGFTQVAKIDKNKTTFYHKPVMDGVTYTYRIKAFNEYGDSDYTEVISVTPPVSTTAARIVVFPNPTVDLINLRVESANEGTISVINQANRRVLSKSVDFGNGDVSLDLSNFAPGAYQLIINTGDTSISKKIYKY